MKKILTLSILLTFFFIFPRPSLGIVDPLSFPNNKYGIHLIDAGETQEAVSLVNSSGGDWGYITIAITKSDRDRQKWQAVFNNLRKRHLLPIIRIATGLKDGVWEAPLEEDAKDWALFLDSLIWPIKNRYVVVYNEPNHAKEWGGKIDPGRYAEVLNKTIDELKSKSQDFFILNAGFDLAASTIPEETMEEFDYLFKVERAVPGIFKKLDGWASHSYPNPNFSTSPLNHNRNGIQGYRFELNFLRDQFEISNLPVFITETGWQHAEGIEYRPGYPSSKMVAQFFETAYTSIWTDPRIVAITPFLLKYGDSLFDHFAWIDMNGTTKFYPQYITVQNLPKIAGKPLQEKKALVIEENIPQKLFSQEYYTFEVRLKNVGQTIWAKADNYQLRVHNAEGFNVNVSSLNDNEEINSLEEKTFEIRLVTPKKPGKHTFSLSMATEEEFFGELLEREILIEEPPILAIIARQLLKREQGGNDFSLKIFSNGEVVGEIKNIKVDSLGRGESLKLKRLIPDKKYRLILEKSFYLRSQVFTSLHRGNNKIVFPALFPGDLWEDGVLNILDLIIIPGKLKDFLKFF